MLSKTTKSIFNKILLWATGLFYIVAGCNHFIHPQTYLSLIPPYFPAHVFLNILSGAVEIISGFFLLYVRTRKFAAVLIILLLIAFLPAHVYMIQKDGCISAALCVPAWVAWLRLPLQFVLMVVAWKAFVWNKG